MSLSSMWSKIWKSTASSTADCLSKGNKQVSSESVHGQNLAVQQLTCDICVEESKVCKGDHTSTEKLDIAENNSKADGSFSHAVINMAGKVIGLGQLSTPYAIENGGWASAFMLIGLGVICSYTAHILGKCLAKNPKSRGYTDIGQQAFGRTGRALAATFIYLEIFMSLVSYTISLHDNLITAFSGTSLDLSFWTKLSTSQILTVIAVLIALPSLWLRDLSSISFLSIAGILMSFIIFLSVAVTTIFRLEGVHANHKIPLLNFHKIPHISGLYIFSYTGHTVFPNLYKDMKDPSKFTKVSIVSFTLVTALYAALGFMGASSFGAGVNSQITLSMPRHLVVTKIALWATALTPMTKYALEFAPVAIQLENKLPRSLSSRSKMIIRGSVGSFQLLIVLTLALSVPYFQYVLSLTGSLVSISICLILPCAFYIKISWPHLSKPLLVLNVTLVSFGFFFGVSGTISSFKSLIQNLQNAHRTGR